LLLFAKRTATTRCQHCTKHCSHASPTPLFSHLQQWRALSLYTRLHYQSRCTDRLRGLYRTNLCKLAVSNTNTALLTHLSFAEEASLISTPRSPSLTRINLGGCKRQLAGYDITFDHSTLIVDALAHSVKILRISCEEALSLYTQAVVDSQRAAAVENESIGREIIDERLFF
jgi:hypothetical protein